MTSPEDSVLLRGCSLGFSLLSSWCTRSRLGAAGSLPGVPEGLRLVSRRIPALCPSGSPPGVPEGPQSVSSRVPARCRRGSRCGGAVRGGGAGRDAALGPPPSTPPALPARWQLRARFAGATWRLVPVCLCPGQRGHGGRAAPPPLEPPELPEPPEPPRATGATGAAGMSALAFDDAALEGLAPSLGLSGASDIDTALLSDIDGASRRPRDGARPGLGA